MYVIPETWRAH